MPVNKYKPTSPGIRFQTHHTFDEITKARPEKSLTKGKPKTGGRNNLGRVTSRFIGGGHKQKYRVIHVRCYATIGQVGNLEHENVSIGKAGRTRHLGKMPHNRGVSMNPVDHPLGGGEGKTSGGRHPVTPWGKPTKGFKTRKNKRTNQFIVKRRTK